MANDRIRGTSRNDELFGTGADDDISGIAGDDQIHGLAGNDRLDGGAGNDTLFGDEGNDDLNGGAGDDRLVGGSGADNFTGGSGDDFLDGRNRTGFARADPDIDTFNGGAGNDTFVVDNAGDVLRDNAGNDTVHVYNMNWTLANGFENLVLFSDESDGATGIGNEADNFMTGTWRVRLEGLGGDDHLVGSGTNDVLLGGEGNDLIGGNGGQHDWLLGEAGNDVLIGREETFLLDGGTGNDTIAGGNGRDSLIVGGAGNDLLTGNAASDRFLFNQAPGAANADHVTDFTSRATLEGVDPSSTEWDADTLVLDANVMDALGTAQFTENDERFYAAAGATSGHDANDRIVYDTSSGNLFYDADGSGGMEALLIATLDGAPTLLAEDLSVTTTAVPSPGPA